MKLGLISLHRSRLEADVLKKECEVYSLYLVDHKPNSYVQLKYAQAHNAEGFAPSLDGTSFDTLLVEASRLHPLAARVADAYTSVFGKNAVVRKKMILLLAILETCAPTYTDFDLEQPQSMVKLCWGMAQQSAMLALSLALGTLLFLPLRAIFALVSIRPGRIR